MPARQAQLPSPTRRLAVAESFQYHVAGEEDEGNGAHAAYGSRGATISKKHHPRGSTLDPNVSEPPPTLWDTDVSALGGNWKRASAEVEASVTGAARVAPPRPGPDRIKSVADPMIGTTGGRAAAGGGGAWLGGYGDAAWHQGGGGAAATAQQQQQQQQSRHMSPYAWEAELLRRHSGTASHGWCEAISCRSISDAPY